MSTEMITSVVARHPWIGEDYRSSHLRLLIVGESHYGQPKDGDLMNYTKNVVREYVDQEWTMAFYTNISQAIAGKKKREIDLKRLWDDISYHNFLPMHMSGPRESPSNREHWESGIPLFLEILNNLKPTHVLILGYRLQGRLTSLDPRFSSEPSPGKASFWKYEDGQAECYTKATYIRHPSSGFSWKKWHPLIAKFLT